MPVRVAILGTIELCADGVAVRVPEGKQRALLCLLAVRAPHPVAAEAATEALWPEAPPAEATRSLQVTVSRLRRSLGAAATAVETLGSGYRLAVADGAIDARRFEALVARARAARADDATAAGRLLAAALALWRGPALADVAFEAFAQGEIARLEELRLVALEERLDLRLAAGEDAVVVGELEQLTVEHPSRERLVRLLMLALYRSGRQSDALEVYTRARRRPDDELGLEPSAGLRELQGAMLRQDPALVPSRGEPVPEGVVTMLFTDIEGSTRLARAAGPGWPQVLEIHHALVAGAVEEAGGHVDGSEGDALFSYVVDPGSAVAAATAAQAALRARDWPEAVGELRVRMGSTRDWSPAPRRALSGLTCIWPRASPRPRTADRSSFRRRRMRCSPPGPSWSTWESIGSRISPSPSGSGCSSTTSGLGTTSRRCEPSRCGRRTFPRTPGGSWAARRSSMRWRACSPVRSVS
jgi:DNA-binding SARP family transcriptional activator